MTYVTKDGLLNRIYSPQSFSDRSFNRVRGDFTFTFTSLRLKFDDLVAQSSSDSIHQPPLIPYNLHRPS